jgi:hypothetical protein
MAFINSRKSGRKLNCNTSSSRRLEERKGDVLDDHKFEELFESDQVYDPSIVNNLFQVDLDDAGMQPIFNSSFILSDNSSDSEVDSNEVEPKRIRGN